MTVQQVYDHITKQISPEEALKRILQGTIPQYQKLRAVAGEDGYPEAIIACAAFELGWEIAVEGDKEDLRGLSVGTAEYLDALLDRPGSPEKKIVY